MEFQLTQKDLASALDTIARRDPRIAVALERVGYPPERRSAEMVLTTSFAVGLQITANSRIACGASMRWPQRCADKPGSVANSAGRK